MSAVLATITPTIMSLSLNMNIDISTPYTLLCTPLGEEGDVTAGETCHHSNRDDGECALALRRGGRATRGRRVDGRPGAMPRRPIHCLGGSFPCLAQPELGNQHNNHSDRWEQCDIHRRMDYAKECKHSQKNANRYESVSNRLNASHLTNPLLAQIYRVRRRGCMLRRRSAASTTSRYRPLPGTAR
jgi:hypothetical protein